VVPQVIHVSEQVPPEPLRRFGLRIVTGVVEVLGGRRPPVQLEEWFSASLRESIARLRRSEYGGLRVRSVHFQLPDPAALEIAAHLRLGKGSRALALRMAKVNGCWRCTHLDFTSGPRAAVRRSLHTSALRANF
jgi:hypothetical protein